uniref:SAM domain-containing protein n=1 Tax=Clastoptera arizonana TaxID=38151 RepID=A0A1B6DPM5_9HEMI
MENKSTPKRKIRLKSLPNSLKKNIVKFKSNDSFPLNAPEKLVDIIGMTMEHFYILPPACSWTLDEVLDWLEYELGLPQYKQSFAKNNISGNKLCHLNASTLPKMNIQDFDHIKIITENVRKVLHVKEIPFNTTIDRSREDPYLMYLKYIFWTGGAYKPMGILDYWRKAGLIAPKAPGKCRWYSMEASLKYPRIHVPDLASYRMRNIYYCVHNPKYKGFDLHSRGQKFFMVS